MGKKNQVMFFIHGWPDTAAEWANQFEYFCDPKDGQYFCVAPTMTDFHPDIKEKSTDKETTFIHQVDSFAMIIREYTEEKVILMVHDWGAIQGYIFTAKYPKMVEKLIAV